MPGIPEAVAGMSPLASLKPGLGASKPPKKKARNEPTEKIVEKPNKKVVKPRTIKCKKKSGTCKHKVVFDEHFGMRAWKPYEEYLKSKTSTTVIDSNYILYCTCLLLIDLKYKIFRQSNFC